MNKIEELGELITKEIRLNRAIRAQFQSLFLKNKKKFIPLEKNEFQHIRKPYFINTLLQEYEEIRKKIERKEKINIGYLSALFKQIEVEEKYLIDQYLKVKSSCAISKFALDYEENLERSEDLNKKNRRTQKSLLILTSFLLIITLILLLS